MDVKEVAKLANLEITKEEIELYTPQMEQIVSYVEQLDELDCAGIEASIGGLTAAGENTDVGRADSPRESFSQEHALSQVPSAVEGHFQVPKVLKNAK